MAEGEPILLVSDGKVLSEHLQRSNIDLDDREQAVGGHGVATLADADTAILEVDGTVSITPAAGNKITMPRPGGSPD